MLSALILSSPALLFLASERWITCIARSRRGGAVPRWHSGIVVLRYAGTEVQREAY